MPEYVVSIEYQEEEKEPYLLELSSLLYDLELAHDFAVLLANKEIYADYRFNRYFWYRKGRPLLKEHRIRTLKIIKQSPLLLEVIVPSLGAIWILVQLFDKVYNFKINRKKLELEVKNLSKKYAENKIEIVDIDTYQEWPGTIEIDSHEIERKLIKRLADTIIKPIEIQIREHKDGTNS